MKLSNNFSFKLVIAISVVFYNYSVLVSAVPQWIWNPDANSRPPSGGNHIIFGSQTAEDSTKDKASAIKIVDTQARLFPSIVSAISNSISGNNNNNNNGGSGVGGIFGSILQNIFGNGASTLPGGIGGGGGNKDPGSGSGTGSCSCVDASACFLPSKPAGSCDGGKTNCCQSTRGSRTIFPDEGDRGSSSTKSVTRSQIRRALFKNIVRGSGSLIDDTLDLVLHPFLTKEDQEKVATRVLNDK